MQYALEVIEVLNDEFLIRKMLHDAGEVVEFHPHIETLADLVKEFDHLVTGEDVVIPRNTSVYYDVARIQRAKYKKSQANKRQYERSKGKK